MTTLKWSPKDPQDVRDYWIDFSSLLVTDETITAATVTVPDELLQPLPDPPFFVLAKVNDSAATETPMVRARFSGGIAATKYAIQYHVTTSSGQEFDLTKTLEVKERTA
jgi:hypothetical protein